MEPGSSEPGGQRGQARRSLPHDRLQWSQVLANPEAAFDIQEAAFAKRDFNGARF